MASRLFLVMLSLACLGSSGTKIPKPTPANDTLTVTQILKPVAAMDTVAEAEPVVASLSSQRNAMHASIEVIIALEGVTDTLHWPQGESGPTIGCGIDLGNIGKSSIRTIFTGVVGPDTVALLLRAADVRGVQSLAFVRRYHNLRLTPEQLDEANRRMFAIMWDAVVERFPGIESAPVTVQTSVLSVAAHRGVFNKRIQHLKPLIASRKWNAVAQAIAAMPAPDGMSGVAKRRKREAQLITQKEFAYDPD